MDTWKDGMRVKRDDGFLKYLGNSNELVTQATMALLLPDSIGGLELPRKRGVGNALSHDAIFLCLSRQGLSLCVEG